MPGSAPLVLSCIVRTVDDLHHSYSLGKDAAQPKPPASRPLSIVSRRGFGRKEAVHLEAHLAEAPALSHLTARGEGARSFDGVIHAVDADLIVLDWCIPTYASPAHLIYDAVNQSITMTTSTPWSQLAPYQPEVKRETAPAVRVLIARLPGGDGYALAKMAETTIHNIKDKSTVKQDFLYVWLSRSQKWFPIRAKFPSLFKGRDVAQSYMTVLPFTCGGHAFWANPFRGIMYCRVDAMLSARGSSSCLKLEFIKLPVEQDPHCPISCALEMRPDMYRTIGRSGKSSIKFVIIAGFVELLKFTDCALKVWTLSQKDMKTWTKSFLCLSSLKEQFKKAGLPTDMVPMYPSLSAQEDNVVYFMLGEYEKCCRAHKGSTNKCNGYIPRANYPRYHIRVDMCRGVLLGSARLPDPGSPSMTIASTSVLPCK